MAETIWGYDNDILKADKEREGKTFMKYNLMGTPSIVLIDREGMLRDIQLGGDGSLEGKVKDLLKSKG